MLSIVLFTSSALDVVVTHFYGHCVVDTQHTKKHTAGEISNHNPIQTLHCFKSDARVCVVFYV